MMPISRSGLERDGCGVEESQHLCRLSWGRVHREGNGGRNNDARRCEQKNRPDIRIPFWESQSKEAKQA
nr:MAG TPA: hypothetical protein [Caudoviricetes sp.]